MEKKGPQPRGRGSHINPPNRFGGPHYVPDLEQVERDEEYLADLLNRSTEYLPDHSRTIVAENDSPDVGFRFSVNPYRGCSHGCSYCYARPTHEYLGLNAGLDFETKIFVKEDAADLFREFLSGKNWVPEPIALSGVTDCYQPAERRFRLTRRCLEVAVEVSPADVHHHQERPGPPRPRPSARDGRRHLVHVNVSITTLDADLARSMEPRTSTPAARLGRSEPGRRRDAGARDGGPGHPRPERQRDPGHPRRGQGGRGEAGGTSCCGCR